MRSLPAVILLAVAAAHVAALPSVAAAQDWKSKVEARPELFHPETGYRIARQRAPTPLDIPPPAEAVDAAEARRLIEAGAVAIDVNAASRSRYDELDGSWLVNGVHESLPGATWLPETGRGTLTAEMEAYLRRNLDRLTGGDLDRAVVVFCIADCWMSWNAAQRIAAMGWRRVRWFRLGVDGWLDAGWPLVPVSPVPVEVD